MFGYLIYNNKEITEEEKKSYQDCYCGLCNRLYFHYDNIGRNTLSYDLTFVNLLLTSIYQPEITSGSEKCLIHPLKMHDYCYSKVTDYCADMNVLLSYYKFLDDYHDDNSRKAGKLAEKLLPYYYSIRSDYPEKTDKIDQCLYNISEMEKHNVLNPDLPANQFGNLMAEVLVYKEDEHAETLRKMGYHLGRFIYLLDAYLDFKDDIRKERYNPLLQTDLEQMPDILENVISQCCIYYEELPIKQFKSILDNVLYSGLWTAYNAERKRR